jgi:hypothetical protein
MNGEFRKIFTLKSLQIFASGKFSISGSALNRLPLLIGFVSSSLCFGKPVDRKEPIRNLIRGATKDKRKGTHSTTFAKKFCGSDRKIDVNFFSEKSNAGFSYSPSSWGFCDT